MEPAAEAEVRVGMHTRAQWIQKGDAERIEARFRNERDRCYENLEKRIAQRAKT